MSEEHCMSVWQKGASFVIEIHHRSGVHKVTSQGWVGGQAGCSVHRGVPPLVCLDCGALGHCGGCGS